MTQLWTQQFQKTQTHGDSIIPQVNTKAKDKPMENNKRYTYKKIRKNTQFITSATIKGVRIKRENTNAQFTNKSKA